VAKTPTIYPDRIDLLERRRQGRREAARRTLGEKIAAMEALRERLAPLKQLREQRKAEQAARAKSRSRRD